jgi:hypothetical protein
VAVQIMGGGSDKENLGAGPASLNAATVEMVQ